MQSFDEQAKGKFLQLLQSEVGLEFFCYYYNNPDTAVTVADLCRLLGRNAASINGHVGTFVELGLIEIKKNDGFESLYFKSPDNPELKNVLDDFVLAHRDEYGAVYKKVLTVQIAEFLKHKYREEGK